MAKQASLPFQGDFQHCQGFGANPTAYAKYGLAGHDGDDWLMPQGTKLYAPVDGKIIKHGNDPGGWGIYLHVWDPSQNLVINIAHFSALQVMTGVEVKRGQQIGFSGNTGNSSAPHVHVAAADTDGAGNRINTDNGYKGWYSILDSGKIALAGIDAATAPPSQTTPDPVNIEGQSLAWADIFKQYYPGWGETEAIANFNIDMGGDLDKLLVARGLKPGSVTVEEKPAASVPAQTYFIKPEYVDMTMKEIAQKYKDYTRLDILGPFIGINENTKIEATRQISISGFPSHYIPDSGEWVWFRKYFWTTPPQGPSVIILPAPIGGVPEQPAEEEIGIPPEVDEGTVGDLSAEEEEPPPSDETQPPSEVPPPSADFAKIIEKLDAILVGLAEVHDKIVAAPIQPPGAPPAPEKQTAAVFIETEPSRASIYIDNQWQADYTPSNSSHLLAPGTHQIRLKKKGYKLYEKAVTLTGGETKFIKVKLEAV